MPQQWILKLIIFTQNRNVFASKILKLQYISSIADYCMLPTKNTSTSYWTLLNYHSFVFLNISCKLIRFKCTYFILRQSKWIETCHDLSENLSKWAICVTRFIIHYRTRDMRKDRRLFIIQIHADIQNSIWIYNSIKTIMDAIITTEPITLPYM